VGALVTFQNLECGWQQYYTFFFICVQVVTVIMASYKDIVAAKRAHRDKAIGSANSYATTHSDSEILNATGPFKAFPCASVYNETIQPFLVQRLKLSAISRVDGGQHLKS
jgi:hypothetical protein